MSVFEFPEDELPILHKTSTLFLQQIRMRSNILIQININTNNDFDSQELGED